jgi:hypothetical protein
MNIDDLRIYLPKYLSSESEHELYSSLKDFPDNIDHRIYTNYLKDEPIIYQGDGINDLLAVNLPDVSIKQIPAMILSNTCDIDPTNKRNFPSQLVYAPIIGFNKYERVLKKDSNKSITQIDEHLASIRKQFITQIFYLPRIEDVLDDSIVFLDRIFNIGNDFVKRESLKASRIFTLSNYGNYLFLFKLSLHFTRIQDKVDRK